MNDRRTAVKAWRWTEERQNAPTLAEMYGRWPDMLDCPHSDLSARTLQNGFGVIVHVECLDCPASSMTLIEPGDLRRLSIDTPDR